MAIFFLFSTSTSGTASFTSTSSLN